MNIDLNQLQQALKIITALNNTEQEEADPVTAPCTNNPMLGRRCLVRTYSAGVHIGNVVWINPENSMEIKLENALRLWKWEDGGLSLSAVANNGIVKGRLNRTGEVMLTNVIEMIPTTQEAETTYAKYIEDDKK